MRAQVRNAANVRPKHRTGAVAPFVHMDPTGVSRVAVSVTTLPVPGALALYYHPSTNNPY